MAIDELHQYLTFHQSSDGCVRYHPDESRDGWESYNIWQDHCPHAITIKSSFLRIPAAKKIFLQGVQHGPTTTLTAIAKNTGQPLLIAKIIAKYCFPFEHIFRRYRMDEADIIKREMAVYNTDTKK